VENKIKAWNQKEKVVDIDFEQDFDEDDKELSRILTYGDEY